MSSLPRKPQDTNIKRMAPLAKLPLFHDLKGKNVVIAGESDGADWKVELLEAAGANVRRLALPVEANALTNCVLAIAEVHNDEEARAFVEAAHSVGVLANVIDKPAFCDFQFGAIVNRSPLVIGISTDGAAPVFGQAIRARIETLLPASFAAWAQTAVVWRKDILAMALPFVARRRFWERFTALAFSRMDKTATFEDRDALMKTTRLEQVQPQKGHVTLLGAGPGDPELLTLKAVRALQNADIILYDDLISSEVLDFARREAKRMLVGKTGHGPSCKQTDINALMVRLAREGKNVVRLKSGDPGIFGRAGEEITACRHAGVSVSIIPGITTAQGAAAAAGFSLTHRDHARRVQFVTGHARDGELPKDIDWATVASSATTTALYMPKATLSAFATNAIAAGLPSHTPALVMTNATRPDQHQTLTTAHALAANKEASLETGPTLVFIGDAVSECDIAWCESQSRKISKNDHKILEAV